MIYTDFSKAFDSVAHERLLVKLQNNGIKGVLLQWIRSFLSGRTQCVNVNGILSDWKHVISGVPQGSVIGPIVFVIFINDEPDEVKGSVCKLFADDCKLYRNVSSSGQNNLQKDLLNLENWSTTWQLPFNATKCKVLHFGTHNANYIYRLNNHTLDSTKNEKDLSHYRQRIKIPCSCCVCDQKGKPSIRHYKEILLEPAALEGLQGAKSLK